jgi:transcriptional regulator with GAF, ATPase, and Fis domain
MGTKRGEGRSEANASGTPQEVEPLVAVSSAFRAILEQAIAIAASPHPVLLLGETGVGKERVARFIHDHGPRRQRPFVAVNCAGLSETLLLSEMFGHVKGAFTGADSDAAGHLRAAAGGTLLLDEVGDLPPAAQSAMLRALDGLEVYPVGSTRAFRIEVRVIAATERDVKAIVGAGAFRHALYQRLACHIIRIPPLRERREDIIPLAEAVLDALRKRGEADGEYLGPQARAALLAYDWPGNARELRNVVTNAIYAKSTAGLAGLEALLSRDLMAYPCDGVPIEPIRASLRREPSDLELQVLGAIGSLGKCSVSRVAKTIGRNRETVRRWLAPLVASGCILRGGAGRGAWVALNQRPTQE